MITVDGYLVEQRQLGASAVFAHQSGFFSRVM